MKINKKSWHNKLRIELLEGLGNKNAKEWDTNIIEYFLTVLIALYSIPICKLILKILEITRLEKPLGNLILFTKNKIKSISWKKIGVEFIE